MLNVLLNDEKLCETGQHTNPQETVEKALKMYVEYLQQQKIIQAFGTVDFCSDYNSIDGKADNANDELLGLFAQETVLVDEMIESVMQARENDSLRRFDE